MFIFPNCERFKITFLPKENLKSIKFSKGTVSHLNGGPKHVNTTYPAVTRSE